MGGTYSKDWQTWLYSFLSSSVFYSSLFFYTFFKFEKKTKLHNETFKNVKLQALLYSTGVVSSINCIISPLLTILGLTHPKSNLTWKQSMLSKKPAYFVFYLYSIFCGYLVGDGIGHIIAGLKYNKLIGIKWDIIFHHTLGMLGWIIVQYPKPIYANLLYGTLLLAEISTIFLNLKWFGEYYNWSHRVKNLVNINFVITWFVFRYFVTLFHIFVFVWFYKEYEKKVSKRILIKTYVIILLNTLMQSYWTVKIIKQIFKIIVKNRVNKVNKIHGLEINMAKKIKVEIPQQNLQYVD